MIFFFGCKIGIINFYMLFAKPIIMWLFHFIQRQFYFDACHIFFRRCPSSRSHDGLVELKHPILIKWATKRNSHLNQSTLHIPRFMNFFFHMVSFFRLLVVYKRRANDSKIIKFISPKTFYVRGMEREVMEEGDGDGESGKNPSQSCKQQEWTDIKQNGV